ncbi:MAG: iron ABC transporter substrate-binding protein [Oscillatoria sp. SIO1A7]|nr:iron ABC transporter substrate-binding protein [Oscillatoria sp. SIO1A7]
MARNQKKVAVMGLLGLLLAWGVGAIATAQSKTLIIYSGRSEKLIGNLIQKAEEDLGIDIEVRYGKTAQLAIAIQEEGRNSKADLFFGQDAGALGSLAKEKRTVPIPSDLLNKVDSKFRSPDGQWIGISGRARVVDYNTKLVTNPSELPSSIWELTDPKWRGKVGWAPTNGSFQSFITAMRLTAGDAKTLEWLKAMKANGTKVYPKNTPIVEALGRGEIELGLVNNYYLYRFTKDKPDFPVAHHYMPGDVGSMINVAGVAIVDTTDQQGDAEKFVRYLLNDSSQNYFAQKTKEYPLVKGIPAPANQMSISQINPPDIDLSNLDDLEGTLKLLGDEEEGAGLL